MPNLLAVRQSRNLSNFGQCKLFIDLIFHVLHTEVMFVAKRKAEKLLYNFVYVPQAIKLTLMAIAQNEIYQQRKLCKTARSKSIIFPIFFTLFLFLINIREGKSTDD